MQYTVHYGTMVPWKSKTFHSWKQTVDFMKTQLDEGIIVRSVSKEFVDDGDSLIQSVDIIGDR